MKRIAFLVLIFACLTNAAAAEKAIFAGGCFWCMEADFEKLEGVTDVISGFTGGELKNPTYKGDHTGHYEAIEITYDPETIDYQGLLDHFWINIDPFDPRGQFCDKGFSYLSAIFVSNEKERELAENSRQKVISRFPDKKLCILPETEIQMVHFHRNRQVLKR